MKTLFATGSSDKVIKIWKPKSNITELLSKNGFLKKPFTTKMDIEEI